jgi:outer membrane protein OmpA-like peptidoglycan-associated protein
MPQTRERSVARTLRPAVASLALVGLTFSIPPAMAQTPERIDYLTLAQGAVPVSIGGAGARQGASIDQALQIIDGDPGVIPVVNRAGADTDVEFVYALPASTTFDRFAVPNVLETPSPGQTFFRSVEIFGSMEGPDGPWAPLASATLMTHRAAGQVSEIPVAAPRAARWVRLRLQGGIEMLREQMFLEFGEIIGNGTQEPVPMLNAFTGSWQARGVRLDLRQDGPLVAGCYDTGGDLTGTVTGNILRATGVDRTTGVPSAFVLSVIGDNALRGVRSTNGAPFRIYEGPRAATGPVARCEERPAPTLGCGSIIHGINFDFDSALIREDSEPVLAGLFTGLAADMSATVTVEGHTSSEGADAYNQALSQRRAQAVVDDLVRRGIPASRLAAAGRGESRPIADNSSETGRSLNRRVEIVCR